MKSICGLRPTGDLHLGHYFSVIEPSVKHDADVLIATFHAPLEPVDVLPTLLRFGVKRIIRQEEMFNAQLYFRLMAMAYPGELGRMTQYRDSDTPTAHLFSYPVLMAHDVAGYDVVYVGRDQTQHMNYIKDLLNRYNKSFDPVNIPTYSVSGGKVMSLREPEVKMSKSDPEGCLFLDDDAAVIRQKIKVAVADEKGRANLVDLLRRVSTEEVVVPKMNSDLKEQLSQAIIAMTCK
jgi:tryptophanyl-tRNA synthetase